MALGKWRRWASGDGQSSSLRSEALAVRMERTLALSTAALLAEYIDIGSFGRKRHPHGLSSSNACNLIETLA